MCAVCLWGVFLVDPDVTWGNKFTGQLTSLKNDEVQFEYWPLFSSGIGGSGAEAAGSWWVTRADDRILDIGSSGDLGAWALPAGHFNFAEIVLYGVTPRLVGPRVGCKGRILRPGPTGRGKGGNKYKIEGGPSTTHPQWIEMVRVRMYAGEPGLENEVGFLQGGTFFGEGAAEELEIMGTWAEEMEFAKEDGVTPPHFSDRWPLLIRSRPPDEYSNPWVIGFLEAGRHRMDVYYVSLGGYLNVNEIVEPCCGNAILGGKVGPRDSDKDVWVVEMGTQMPNPPPPPPVMITGPGAGTTPLSYGLFPKGTNTDIRQSQARFRAEMKSPAPFDVHLAFVAKRVAGSGGHEAQQHEPKNTNVEGDLTGRKGTVGIFPHMFMRIPTGEVESVWNTYTSSDFGGTEVIQMYVSEGRFSAEEKYGVNPGGSNLAAAIAVLEAEAKDTCRIDTFVQIRVPYLEEMPPGGSSYEKVGGTCVHHGPSDKPLTGPDGVPAECRNPDNNHWGKQELVDTIRNTAFNFGGGLRVNDMSLPQGGVFDIHGNWKKPHSPKMGHAQGRGVDISTRRVGSTVRDKNAVRIALLGASLTETTDTTRFQPSFFFIEDEGKSNEHYHVMR